MLACDKKIRTTKQGDKQSDTENHISTEPQ